MKTDTRAARSSWPWAAFAVAAVLSGCATQSGPPLSSLATMAGPPKGMARIVVVRTDKGYRLAIGDRAFRSNVMQRRSGSSRPGASPTSTARQARTSFRPNSGIPPA
jgi:hypothetical protein